MDLLMLSPVEEERMEEGIWLILVSSPLGISSYGGNILN